MKYYVNYAIILVTHVVRLEGRAFMERIHYAQMCDYEDFRRLHENFSYAGNFGVRKNIIVKEKEFEDFVLAESLFLLSNEKGVIGYAVMEAYDDGSCKIQEIFISKKEQRRGLGRLFVRLIKDVAKSEGFTRIFLLSVNIKTDDFWSKCGFTSVNGSDQYEIEL